MPLPLMPLLVAFGTFCMTIIGGLVALRLRDRLHLVLGFSAGAVLGVALFDLLPEAMRLAQADGSAGRVPLWLAVGFVAYMLLDRLAPVAGAAPHEASGSPNRLGATLGAGSFSLHSFLDGFGIGLAFHVSAALGFVMAAAVLAHDFSDGVNLMNIVLKNGGSRALGLRWLAVDALAPALGVGVSYAIGVPQSLFGALLALFAGFFLYIGASDLVPESYHAHPKMLTTLMTLLGLAVIYASVHLAH